MVRIYYLVQIEQAIKKNYGQWNMICLNMI